MSENIKISSNRSFGIVFFVVFLLIAIYPMINQGELRLWSLLISFTFLVLGIINSKLLTPLNRLWFKFGLFLGKIVSPLVMGIIFFSVVTPIGLFMRLFKKDLLSLKYNDEKSYWVETKETNYRMNKQF